jgi:hypothetical protein
MSKHFSLVQLNVLIASLALVLLCIINVRAASAVTATSPGWGSHGMAVFGGNEGLYASHLPMFHVPHDAQVVFRFHLKDPATDIALRRTLTSKPELWTLDPEKFDLHRFEPGHTNPLKQFSARFVQGHFERDGKERYLNQTVVVDEIIIFQRLSFTPRVESKGRYRVIGKGLERFVLKEIDRRPDFDLIATLKPPVNNTAPLPMPMPMPMPNILLLPTNTLQAPSTDAWNIMLSKQAGNSASFGTLLYFETGDLK